MDSKHHTTKALAAQITKAASSQTYYTIRFFADRDLVDDAYRAYAYFRWVDDILDSPTGSPSEKAAFASRQVDLLETCCRGESPNGLSIEERMLAELVQNDTGMNPGLCSYLRNMMAVMVFDSGRRGRLISKAELSEYSRALARAVSNAMYYFIGHDDPAPQHKARYLAVEAAHITHMLRDAVEDAVNGYYNIPREYLQAHGITPQDVDSQAYREWVRMRVQIARTFFTQGRESIGRVVNWRCRLAGYAYSARFEWVLRLIERDNFLLRSEYPDRKGFRAFLWIGWSTLISMLGSLWTGTKSHDRAQQPLWIE